MTKIGAEKERRNARLDLFETMKKIRLDDFDLRTVVSCLYHARGNYPAEKRNEIDSLLLSLIDTHDQMRPGKRKAISMQVDALHLIHLCLNDLRNAFLSTGEAGKADAIAEMMLRLNT